MGEKKIYPFGRQSEAFEGMRVSLDARVVALDARVVAVQFIVERIGLK
jgi:hypothetical protein